MTLAELQEVWQAKFAATQRRREHENALAAHVSLRQISDRNHYLQVGSGSYPNPNPHLRG